MTKDYAKWALVRDKCHQRSLKEIAEAARASAEEATATQQQAQHRLQVLEEKLQQQETEFAKEREDLQRLIQGNADRRISEGSCSEEVDK